MNVLLAFATAAFISWLLSFWNRRGSILDYPNQRSLHTRPIPRTGGLAILAGLAVGISANWVGRPILSDHAIIFMCGGFIPLIVVSLMDDYRSIAAKWRLLAHVWSAVSLFVIVGSSPYHFGLPGSVLSLSIWVAIPLTLLFVTWAINLYNFMDGMDGFAGGMAVIGFSTLAWLGRVDEPFMNVCLIVAAANAGFLIHNFPPAKIFMGDTGSTALGFLVAACSLWGSKSGLFPFWVAILVFSPFIVDATATLLRRLLRGERVWEAHRTHYYQRLVLLGWGHRRTVLAEYGLMLACAGSAVVAVHLPPAGQWVLIVGWIVIYSFLMWGVGRLERRHATVSAP